MKTQEQFFMNIQTGSVDTYDSWDYEDEYGNKVNAVDLGEAIEVVWDSEEEYWVEVE